MSLSKYLPMALSCCFLLGLNVSTARAECYDTYGCTDKDVFNSGDLVKNGPTCDFLYTMRNQIYAGHGYCFRTARAQSMFGTGKCSVKDINDLDLNSYERRNAATIAQVERAKGCPR